MLPRSIRAVLITAAVALMPAAAAAQTTLITNVNGYAVTPDRAMMGFSALQFTDGVIDRVFVAGEALPTDPAIERIDGQGRTMLPGLIDAHGHVLSYGLSLLRVDLQNVPSEREAVERIRRFRAENPTLEWIQGRGWNQVLWESNEFPTAAMLDEFFPTTPIWLSRVDGHAGWANSAAMAAAGITADTPDPAGGQIIRDAQGRPTGTFVDNAMSLISSSIPSLTVEEQAYALRRAMEELAAQGLTSVHDAGISSTTVDAYKRLLEDGPLPIRVNAMLAAGDPEIGRLLDEGHFASEDGTFTINSVKISSDGALGSRGASLIEDYSDMPGHRGLLLLEPKELHERMERAMRAGFQVNIHAIGDNANKLVLDYFSELIPATGTRHLRHRIEHAQVLRLEDILRFAEIGVIPSMQATHATSDKNMAEDRVGPERILGAYAWRKLMDAGAVIANGSDFPVEYPNPFFGLHAAITRQDHENQPPGGWYPEERMTPPEALASFTIDAAYAGHQEDMLGSLEPGKAADFILLDEDPFAGPPEDIWKAEVVETWVGGELATSN